MFRASIAARRTLTFKVWNADRTKRKSLRCECDVDVLIRKASEKLNIVGSHLVLEEDGTDIDDNEVLEDLASQGKVFQLLHANTRWRPGGGDSQPEPEVDGLQDQQLPEVNTDPGVSRETLQLRALELHDRRDERNRSRWMTAGGVALMIGGGAAAAAAAPVLMAAGVAALTVEAAAVAGAGVAAAVSGTAVTGTGLVGVVRNS